MRKFFTVNFLFISLILTAQTTADFEDFNLPGESFLNGSDGNGGFLNGNIFLPNSYDDSFDSWTGWSISNTTNTTTAGFTNQYSAITGGGVDNSNTYAVAYTGGGRVNMVLENEATGENASGFYITNSTYAYLSMQNGDSFAKKFGGVVGTDPDYFLLTVKKYLNDELSTDSVNVYLADYRFDDSSEDYILDEWTYVDLTSLGNADSLQFFLISSDVGAVGMNTPAYFCIDNFRTSDGITAIKDVSKTENFSFYPNPVNNYISIKNKDLGKANYQILDNFGRIVKAGTFITESRIETNFLPQGMYIIKVEQEGIFQSRKFVKE